MIERASHIHAPLRAIGFKVAATLAFSVMAASVKWLEGRYPVGEVIFFRTFFALVPVLTFAAVAGNMRAQLSTRRPMAHVQRSGLGIAAMFLSFIALSALPLADWTAISFAMPIFAVVLAALWLKEKVGIWRWSAVAAGFLGIILMVGEHLGLQAGAGVMSFAALIMLASTMFSACVIVTIREISATETSLAIVFYFMLACTLASLVTLPFGWLWPMTWEDGAVLVLTGVAGGLGQIFNTTSYRYGEPSLLAPFDYAAMVWAIALGFLLFSEVPSPMVLSGASIVIAAGIVIAMRERSRHKQLASGDDDVTPA